MKIKLGLAKAAAVCVCMVACATASAVTQEAMATSDWEIANAQVTAPIHVQIAIDNIALDDQGQKGPLPCTLNGRVERVFRGALTVGQVVAIQDNCIVHDSGIIGGIEYGFYFTQLNQSKRIEAFLADGGKTIAGHAAWIIADFSDQPRHPAPASVPPKPASGNVAKNTAGAIKGLTPIQRNEFDARSAFQKGEFKTAFKLAAPLAEKGTAEFQVMMGAILEKGASDVDKDLNAAAQWYRKAAEQKNALGSYHLGRLYVTGSGVAQNNQEAEKWLAEAMRQNYTPAKELYASIKNKQDRLIGLGRERFSALFVSGQELPGTVSKTQTSLDIKVGARDAFTQLEGIRGGTNTWMGSNPDAYFRVVDMRWTFPSYWTAKAYLAQNATNLSENLPPLTGGGDLGEQSLAFADEGNNKLATALGIKLRNWIFLVRQGNVVAKLYLTADPVKQPELDNAKALATARLLAQRLKTAD